jgi:PTS system N-acetylglucosamine-specific IIC component
MFEQLQKIGKALMLPIAVLPAAALLLRIGVLLSSDLKVADGTALTVVWNVMTIAGDAVFGNLALLFAIGVAVGLTEGAGVAAEHALRRQGARGGGQC